MISGIFLAGDARAFENFTAFTRLNKLTRDASHDPFGLDPLQTIDAISATPPEAPAPETKSKKKPNSKVATAKGDAGPPDPWGPVESPKLSIVNLAPGLLSFFNNAPVFGVPGTITGDRDGARTELARRGWFVDLYTTSAHQDVTSGGIKTGVAFVQNTQLSVNVDLGRTGLTDGGLFHFTLQSRYGAPPGSTFNAGTATPQYAGLVEPGPHFYKNTMPSEYFLV